MSRSRAEILYGKRAIYIPAEFIELMAHYLAREMESNGIQNYSQGMTYFYKMSMDFLTGDPPWGESYYILNDIKTNNEKTEFSTLINLTIATISSIGEEISVSTLSAIEIQNKPIADNREQWGKSVKTKSLKNLLDLTLKLVQDDSFEDVWATFEGWEDEWGGKANTELTIL